jgi:hypothetical protein
MLNIHELERRWLRYKIKRSLPLALTAILSVIFLGTTFYVLNRPDVQPSLPSAVTSVKPVIHETPVPVSEAPKELSLPEKEHVNQPITQQGTVTSEQTVKSVSQPATQPVKPSTTLTLKPSLDFIYDIEDQQTAVHAVSEENVQPATPTVEKPVVTIKPVANTVKPVAVKQSEPVVPAAKPVATETVSREQTEIQPQQTAEQPASSKISIITKQDEDDLNDVIQRFRTNKNPALSLFIAKRYYSLGAYQKSYNYALMTNDINSEIEESWIIFAKSLVKLNQKEMAIKTLQSYLQKHESTQAKQLIDEIRSGAFR